MSRAHKSPSRRSGFTLVELLTAMAVLVLMIGLLAQVLSSTQRGLAFLGNSAQRRQDAGTVLTNMAKDIRASLHPMSPSYEGADPLAGQFQLLINPAGVPVGSGASNVANPNTIFWNSYTPNSTGGSGLVGYTVRWGTTAAGTPQPLLCRMFVNTVQKVPQLNLLQTAGSTTAQWPTTALLATYAPADANNGYQGWLADNIIALYVRALDPNMKPITNAARTIDGAGGVGGYTYGGQGVYLNSSLTGPPLNNQYDSRYGYQYTFSGNTINKYGPALPSGIEMVIVAAEPRDISRLSAPIDSNATYNATQDMWTNVDTFIAGLPAPIKKSARVYSTIVIP